MDLTKDELLDLIDDGRRAVRLLDHVAESLKIGDVDTACELLGIDGDDVDDVEDDDTQEAE